MKPVKPVIPLKVFTDPDEHLSGCDTGCQFPLHLTAAAVETLSQHGVPESVVASALAAESRSHEVSDRPISKGEWTPRVEAALRAAGVAEEIVEAARARVEKRGGATSQRALRVAQAQADRTKTWKEQHKDRVAQHSRDYRKRLRERLQVVR